MTKTDIKRLTDYMPTKYQGELFCITVNEVLPPKTLHIIYDKIEKGLYCMLEADDEAIQKAISNSLDEIFPLAVRKIDEDNYVLNIAPDENFAAFEWRGEWAKNLVNKQLSAYQPIIQKFMADAATDSLVL